jgi:hypothetical protein
LRLGWKILQPCSQVDPMQDKTLNMSDLKILSNSRRNSASFLGAMGDFLRETLDNDKLVQKIAPQYFNYWGPHSNRHSGRTARMILKDFQGKQLIIIKAADYKGDQAEMVLFSTALPVVSIHVINDLLQLVSNRWSQGKLRAKVSLMNKMCPGLVESLKKAGWKESAKAGYLEIDLVEKYKRDR